MTQVRMICVVMVAALFLFISRQAARGDADWLGLCGETPVSMPNGSVTTSNPSEQPNQKCNNLQPCVDNFDGDCKVDNFSICNATDRVAEGVKDRTIQVGDCEATSTTTGQTCYHCITPKRMICYVRYIYHNRNSGECSDRCSKPKTQDMKEGKCKA